MTISNESKKLVISNRTLSSIFVTSSVALPHLIFGVLLTINGITNVITESLILRDSKLDCIRDSGEVICSLTGSNAFTNIEKVLSSKNGELIKVNVQGRNEIDALLVLVTRNKEILLYTQREIVERQALELNSFLENKNPLQNKVYIQAQKLSSPDYSNLLFTVAFILCWDFFLIHWYFSVIREIFNRKIYVFDKERQELTILTSLKKNILFKISIQNIRQIQLEKLDDKYKICFLDEFNSTLFFMDNLGSSTANKLVELTSSFLQIEPCQTINKETLQETENSKVVVASPSSSSSKFIRFNENNLIIQNYNLHIFQEKIIIIFLLILEVFVVALLIIVSPFSDLLILMSPLIFIFLPAIIMIYVIHWLIHKSNGKIYIFSKELGKLIIMTSFGRKLVLEISLQRLNRISLKIIHVKRDGNYKIFKDFTIYDIDIFDEDNSLLISINYNDSNSYSGFLSEFCFFMGINAKNEVNKVADSICTFLNLPPYQENDDIPK